MKVWKRPVPWGSKLGTLSLVPLLGSEWQSKIRGYSSSPQITGFVLAYEGEIMKRNTDSFRTNSRLARQLWGDLSRIALRSLRELTARYSLSVAAGDLQLLDGRWYVTHSGLLQLASRRGCRGINTMLQHKLSDILAGRWVFRAVVYKSGLSKGFVGYGDADPSNVSSMVRGAELRIAETRAVNRALRKAYGIGLCSMEELGRSRAHRVLGCFLSTERAFLQRKWQWPAATPRSALPFDPPVQPRCQSREGLCGRFLRHRHP